MAKADTTPAPRPPEEEQRKPGAAGSRTTMGGPRPFMTSFLEHLVRNRIISEEVAMQASEWKKQNERDKRSLIEILKEEFGLSQDVLHYQVAQFYAFRVIDINERGARRLLPSDVLKILRGLPEPIRQLAMRHKVLPYDLAENQPDKIIVVTPNPADREISDVARALPYKKFEICYMKERDWAEYWRQLTTEKDQPGSSALSAADLVIEENEADFEEIIEKDITRGQLLAMVENILADAVRVGATDIHVIPRGPRKTDVSFRIDGQLALWYSIDDTRAEAVAAAIKTRTSSMDRFERLAAQEGTVQKSVDSQLVRFSISSLPMVSRELSGKYESVVIKVHRDAEAASLDAAVGDPYALRVVKEALQRPRGMVLVAGPSGNGRTATVAALLKAVMKGGMNTVTVEDPLEYYLDGARQVKLNPKLTYEDALAAVLHHDPDVVFLGDIEHPGGAAAGLRLAVAGRHVFGKMHARDCTTAVARLLTLGIEPFLVAEGLSVILAQRQVRKLCERCKEPVQKVSRELVTRLGFTEEDAAATSFFRPVGCINCTAGYKGRLPLHEALDVTPEIREIILWSGGRLDGKVLRDAALAQGMVTIQKGGIELLKRGVTTLAEIGAALA
ncbi:MAG: ATPase, T2SS/T4P/T4SS family [Bacteroidota bacterium]